MKLRGVTTPILSGNRLQFLLAWERCMSRRIKPYKKERGRRLYWPNRESANYRVFTWALRNGKLR